MQQIGKRGSQRNSLKSNLKRNKNINREREKVITGGTEEKIVIMKSNCT